MEQQEHLTLVTANYNASITKPNPDSIPNPNPNLTVT